MTHRDLGRLAAIAGLVALPLGPIAGCNGGDEEGDTIGTGGTATATGGFGAGPTGPFGTGGNGRGGFGARPGGGGFGNEDNGYSQGTESFTQCLAEFCPIPTNGEACCVRNNGPCGVDRGGGCVEGRPSDYEGEPSGDGGRGGGGRGGRGGMSNAPPDAGQTPEGGDAQPPDAAPPIVDAGVEASSAAADAALDRLTD
jgi:hypothetical protein